MNLPNDAFPDNPDFDVQAYNAMNRREVRDRKKIEHYEVSYASDSSVWNGVVERTDRISLPDWYVKLPSDELLRLVDQAQKQHLACLAKRRKLDPGTPAYEKLTREAHAWNEKTHAYQHALLHPTTD